MNTVRLSGEVFGDVKFSHECYGEKFYEVFVKSKRTSDNEDILLCVVSEIFVSKIHCGEKIGFIGEIRTRNEHDMCKSRLRIVVFVKALFEYAGFDENEVKVTGFLCKEAYYRETPLGREITDLLIANNDRYGRSNYIPCICWERRARWASSLDVGTKVDIVGRMQSRIYVKKFEDGTTEFRTAYELSVREIKVNEDGEDETWKV